MSVNYKSLRDRYSNYKEKGVGNDKDFTNGKRVLDVTGVEGVSFWKPEVGVHAVDIIPYRVSTDNHPKIPSGEVDYVLEYWAHKSIGPDKDDFLCLSKMGMGKCPICEDRDSQFSDLLEKNKREISDGKVAFKATCDTLRYLEPKHRVLYNIIDLDNEEAGIQLFDSPFFWMEQPMVGEFLSRQARKPNMPYFWQHDEGSSILITTSEETYNNNKFNKSLYKGLENRESQYTDDVIDVAYSLDSFLVVPDYEDVKRAHYGVTAQKVPSEPHSEPQSDSTKKVVRKVIGKKATTKKVGQELDCPVDGGIFGEDFMGFNDCEQGCPIASECEAANKMNLG